MGVKQRIEQSIKRAKREGRLEDAADFEHDLVALKAQRSQATMERGRSYTVQPGDSYFSIAQEQLGDERWAKNLVQANPKLTHLRPGMVIVIPKGGGAAPTFGDQEYTDFEAKYDMEPDVLTEPESEEPSEGAGADTSTGASKPEEAEQPPLAPGAMTPEEEDVLVDELWALFKALEQQGAGQLPNEQEIPAASGTPAATPQPKQKATKQKAGAAKPVQTPPPPTGTPEPDASCIIMENSEEHMARGIFAHFIVAFALLTSCSAPADEQPPEPTPSPTPSPENYSDLSELFEARTASGEWTVEDGLISMLELLAGKSSGDDFLAGAQITSPAGTGILLRAQNYLQTGNDENAKTEMRRLLAALVPSMETLDLYSGRTAADAGRAPGHSAQVDCRTLQSEGFPEEGATQCFEYYEATVDGDSVIIYFPEGWGDDESRRPYLEATQQAVTDSMRAYDGLGLTHRTLYVFFTLLEYEPGGAPADLTYASADLASATAATSNCLAAIYPAGSTAGAERGFEVFKQILAHELFHCYQFWNYNDAAMAVPHSENDWWMEGTAEYFSNFVYSTANAEYEYLGSFDRRSPSRSIIDMDYQNFLFFQYLANEIGNAGVLRLIEAMPTAGGASQADALAAFPDIEELFHNFGRAYLDGQIMDTGGGMVPGNPRFNDLIVFDETYVDAIPPVDRFILRRFKLIFPEEHHFELEVGSDGGEGSNGVRLGAAGAWEPMASGEFDVGCGTREQTLLVTTSAAEPYHLLLDVTVEDGPRCDECLLGLWELDNASYEAYWNASPAGEAESVEYRGVTGLMWATYGEDGVVMNGWTDFTINYHQALGGSVPNMAFAIILNGSGSAYYSAFGDVLTYSESVSDYAVVVTMNGDPVGSSGITPEAVGGGMFGSAIRYICTDETLQFISTEFPQLNELIFLRSD